MALKILLGFLIFYVSLCGLAFLFQGKALFPVDAARSRQPLPPGAERLRLAAGDGVRLAGVHLAPLRAGTAMPVILAFGGNAWNADAAAEYLRDLYPGADIVAFHYRGYAPSEGKPATAALLTDSLLVHGEVVRRFPGRPVVVVGFSIGSGIAAHVAALRPVAGAILVTPFDSLAAVAAKAPWLPVRLLWRNRLDPAAELSGSQVPSPSSPPGATRSSPPPAPTRSAAPCRTSSSTAPFPAPATTTSTARPPSTRRWTRRLRRSSHPSLRWVRAEARRRPGVAAAKRLSEPNPVASGGRCRGVQPPCASALPCAQVSILFHRNRDGTAVLATNALNGRRVGLNGE